MVLMVVMVVVVVTVQIFCLAGRSHAYEGKNMYQLTFTARLMRALGCQILIATNASGGCGEGMVPGCLMVITDHINLYHRNPVAGTGAFSFGFFCKFL